MAPVSGSPPANISPRESASAQRFAHTAAGRIRFVLIIPCKPDLTGHDSHPPSPDSVNVNPHAIRGNQSSHPSRRASDADGVAGSSTRRREPLARPQRSSSRPTTSKEQTLLKGSIKQRSPGSWQIRVFLGRDPQGKIMRRNPPRQKGRRRTPPPRNPHRTRPRHHAPKAALRARRMAR